MEARDKLGRFQKGNKLGKGHTPSNKIKDDFTDLDLTRQRKYYLRKKRKDGLDS